MGLFTFSITMGAALLLYLRPWDQPLDFKPKGVRWLAPRFWTGGLLVRTYTTVAEEVIADAVQALQVARATPRIDGRRLFVVGHSLGACWHPGSRTKAGGVSGLILLAAPGRPRLEVILEQLRAAHRPAAAVAELESQVRRLPALPDQESRAGACAYYWRDLAARDELSLARRLQIPVLLVRGEADRNVSATDQRLWETALGPQGHQTRSFAGVDHSLTVATTGPARHVPAALLDAMAAFIWSAAPVTPPAASSPSG